MKNKKPLYKSDHENETKEKPIPEIRPIKHQPFEENEEIQEERNGGRMIYRTQVNSSQQKKIKLPEYKDEKSNGPVEEWLTNSLFMIELGTDQELKDHIIISELLAALSSDLQYRVNTELQRQMKQNKNLATVLK